MIQVLKIAIFVAVFVAGQPVVPVAAASLQQPLVDAFVVLLGVVAAVVEPPVEFFAELPLVAA